MFKIKNPFKNRSVTPAGTERRSNDSKSIGELAWKSVNLENEPKIKQVKVI